MNVQGSRFKVQGSRFRVQGSGFRVQGSGFNQGLGFMLRISPRRQIRVSHTRDPVGRADHLARERSLDVAASLQAIVSAE